MRVFKAIKNHLKKAQYIYICAFISLVVIFLGLFRFPNFLGRLVESCKDFGLSVAYAFCDLFDIENEIVPTVNDFADYSFLNVSDWLWNKFKIKNPLNISNPTTSFPVEISLFLEKRDLYWQAFVTKKVFP